MVLRGAAPLGDVQHVEVRRDRDVGFRFFRIFKILENSLFMKLLIVSSGNSAALMMATL